MKRPNPKTMNRLFCTLIALLFLGMATHLYAQQEKSGKKDKKPKQEQQDKVQQDKQKQSQQQVKRPSQQGKRVKPGEKRGVWQQHRARSWQAEHRTWKQRGGYNGYRIPKNSYRSYFGRDHRFRIYRRALVMYEGYPCFQYNGYWFSLVDGRNTGRTIGTKTMMFTSSIPMTDIICTTEGIPTLELQSAFL